MPSTHSMMTDVVESPAHSIATMSNAESISTRKEKRLGSNSRRSACKARRQCIVCAEFLRTTSRDAWVINASKSAVEHDASGRQRWSTCRSIPEA